MVSRNRGNTNLEKGPVSSQSKTDNEVDDHDTTLNIPWSSFIPRYPQSRIPYELLANIIVVNHVLGVGMGSYNGKLRESC